MVNFNVEGIPELIEQLERVQREFRPEVLKSFEKLNNKFLLDVKINQMSGRPGLREKSGYLKKSFKSKLTNKVNKVSDSIRSNCVYFNVHQYGYDFGNRIIPKRLNVVELMMNNYEQQYVNAVQDSFDKVKED